MVKYALVHRNGQRQGHRIAIEQSKLVIGRSTDCDLQLATPDISRKHCVLMRTDKGVFVRDFASRNGTLVNGNLIPSETAIELHHRDKLQCGKWKFRFLAEAPEAIVPSGTLKPSGTMKPSGGSGPTPDRQAEGALSRARESGLAIQPSPLPHDLLSELDQIAASLNISVDNIAETQTAVMIEGFSNEFVNSPADTAAEVRSPRAEEGGGKADPRDSGQNPDTNAGLSQKKPQFQKELAGQGQKDNAVDAGEGESEEQADKGKAKNKPEPNRLPDHLRPKAPIDSQDAAERALRKMFGG